MDEEEENSDHGLDDADEDEDQADEERRVNRVLQDQNQYMQMCSTSAQILQMLSHIIPDAGDQKPLFYDGAAPETTQVIELDSLSDDSDQQSTTPRSGSSSGSGDTKECVIWAEPIMTCQLIPSWSTQYDDVRRLPPGVKPEDVARSQQGARSGASGARPQAQPHTLASGNNTLYSTPGHWKGCLPHNDASHPPTTRTSTGVVNTQNIGAGDSTGVPVVGSNPSSDATTSRSAGGSGKSSDTSAAGGQDKKKDLPEAELDTLPSCGLTHEDFQEAMLKISSAAETIRQARLLISSVDSNDQINNNNNPNVPYVNDNDKDSGEDDVPNTDNVEEGSESENTDESGKEASCTSEASPDSENKTENDSHSHFSKPILVKPAANTSRNITEGKFDTEARTPRSSKRADKDSGLTDSGISQGTTETATQYVADGEVTGQSNTATREASVPNRNMNLYRRPFSLRAFRQNVQASRMRRCPRQYGPLQPPSQPQPSTATHAGAGLTSRTWMTTTHGLSSNPPSRSVSQPPPVEGSGLTSRNRSAAGEPHGRLRSANELYYKPGDSKTKHTITVADLKRALEIVKRKLEKVDKLMNDVNETESTADDRVQRDSEAHSSICVPTPIDRKSSSSVHSRNQGNSVELNLDSNAAPCSNTSLSLFLEKCDAGEANHAEKIYIGHPSVSKDKASGTPLSAGNLLDDKSSNNYIHENNNTPDDGGLQQKLISMCCQLEPSDTEDTSKSGSFGPEKTSPRQHEISNPLTSSNTVSTEKFDMATQTKQTELDPLIETSNKVVQTDATNSEVSLSMKESNSSMAESECEYKQTSSPLRNVKQTSYLDILLEHQQHKCDILTGKGAGAVAEDQDDQKPMMGGGDTPGRLSAHQKDDVTTDKGEKEGWLSSCDVQPFTDVTSLQVYSVTAGSRQSDVEAQNKDMVIDNASSSPISFRQLPSGLGDAGPDKFCPEITSPTSSTELNVMFLSETDLNALKNQEGQQKCEANDEDKDSLKNYIHTSESEHKAECEKGKGDISSDVSGEQVTVCSVSVGPTFSQTTRKLVRRTFIRRKPRRLPNLSAVQPTESLSNSLACLSTMSEDLEQGKRVSSKDDNMVAQRSKSHEPQDLSGGDNCRIFTTGSGTCLKSILVLNKPSRSGIATPTFLTPPKSPSTPVYLDSDDDVEETLLLPQAAKDFHRRTPSSNEDSPERYCYTPSNGNDSRQSSPPSVTETAAPAAEPEPETSESPKPSGFLACVRHIFAPCTRSPKS